jgi:hypothetical protein
MYQSEVDLIEKVSNELTAQYKKNGYVVIEKDDKDFQGIFKAFKKARNGALVIFSPNIWLGSGCWIVHVERWCIAGEIFEELNKVGWEVARIDSKSGVCYNNHGAPEGAHHLDIVIRRTGAKVRID